MTLSIRTPESIYRAQGPFQNGTFSGRWHFIFGKYYDAKFVNFAALRVFNDGGRNPLIRNSIGISSKSHRKSN